jgi:2-hydroxy-3-oxopropionate reductase
MKRARSAGAKTASDAATVGGRTRVILTSLPDAHVLQEVIFGSGGLLSGGRVPELIVDTSTVLPAEARAIAADLAARGVGFLDAPVSGGVQGAETGQLSIMVGGSTEDLERARPILESIARAVTHCGPVGAGQITKACNQLIVMATLEAVAETLVLADEVGLDPNRTREALLSGFAASPILEGQGLRMLRHDFAPGGKSVFHIKDIVTIRQLAQEASLELPGFEAAAAHIEQLVAGGSGDLDHSAVVMVVERRPLSRPRSPQEAGQRTG